MQAIANMIFNIATINITSDENLFSLFSPIKLNTILPTDTTNPKLANMIQGIDKPKSVHQARDGRREA